MTGNHSTTATDYGSEFLEIQRRNGRILFIGSIITALVTALLFLVSWLVPVEPIRTYLWNHSDIYLSGNPFTQLRLLGGFWGALFVGYFVRDHLGNRNFRSGMWYGAFSGTIGVGIVYVTLFAYNLASAILNGYFPPPILVLLITPATFLFPLFLLYFLEGAVAGVVGVWICKRHEEE